MMLAAACRWLRAPAAHLRAVPAAAALPVSPATRCLWSGVCHQSASIEATNSPFMLSDAPRTRHLSKFGDVKRFKSNESAAPQPVREMMKANDQDDCQDSETQRKSFNTHTFAMMSALPVVPALGALSMPEPLLGPTAVWLLSSCIPVTGGIALGLPGLAAQAFFISPMPVMKKIISEKSVGQLPMLPYSSMCASGYLWIVYGLLCDNPAIWLPNIPAFVLGGAFTAIFYKNCLPDATGLPGTRNMHALGVMGGVGTVTAIAAMLDTTTAISSLGWLGTGVVISMFGGPLAAMKTVIATKNTSSLPFMMTVATFVNCSLWTVYGTCVISDFFIWFPNGLGLLSSLVQFSLFAKYGFAKETE